jgi:hypothetical protein
MNKTVREASKIGPCAEHSRHPSIVSTPLQ